jgi:hypothetical protein
VTAEILAEIPAARWPRAYSAPALRRLAEQRHQGRPYRELASGVVVLRRQWSSSPRRITYWAFADNLEVASLTRTDGIKDAPCTGHICGDYSRVQGRGADCTTFTAWIAEVLAVAVDDIPVTRCARFARGAQMMLFATPVDGVA